MFFDMNVSNTKSKNLVLASPFKQNLNKIRNCLGVSELIVPFLAYARHNKLTIRQNCMVNRLWRAMTKASILLPALNFPNVEKNLDLQKTWQNQIDKSIGETVMKKFSGQLWYMSKKQVT